jgi:hypothetical protein
MKLAICEAMRFLPDELESGDLFEVRHIVQFLHLLKKIDYGVLEVWATMERHSGPVHGYIQHFQFHYSDIEINYLADDEEEDNSLRLVHRLINEELKQLEALLA